MKNSTVAKIVLLAAVALPLFAGCMSAPPTNVAPQVATADGVYTGQPTQPPPADQQDVVPVCPGPVPQWYFINGYWDWRGQWVWVPGHWRPRPHSGDIWLPGKWLQETNQAQQTNVYVWHGGHWRSEAPDDKESTDK
jgi:hypothetical protein